MNVEPVEAVLREGRCTPNCLLALGDERSHCDCRCRGAYHGALADHQVVENRTAWNWYEPQDVVYLRKNEYAEILDRVDSFTDYNRAYHQSYGRFQCVVKELSHRYSVVFDHYQHGVARYDLKRWDKLCHFCDLLLAAGMIDGCDYPTNPDANQSDGRHFEFRAWGIKDYNTAVVIHDTMSNYVYACDYADRLSDYIQKLESYLSTLGGRYTFPATHLTEEQLARLSGAVKSHVSYELVSAVDIEIKAPRSKGRYSHE